MNYISGDVVNFTYFKIDRVFYFQRFILKHLKSDLYRCTELSRNNKIFVPHLLDLVLFAFYNNWRVLGFKACKSDHNHISIDYYVRYANM